MVVLDPGRDYYSDLELSPLATPNEVKKQFKKLAFKYHPDRNPGHEVEYNAKFQAIANASEILSDPSLRAKFDAQRLKGSPPKASTEPAGRPNVPPRNHTNTNFPPPPRPPPASATKSTYTPTGSGTYRKNENFGRAGAGWSNVDPADARARTSDFKAWDQMLRGHGAPPPRRTAPPKAGKAGTSDHKSTSPPGTGKFAKETRSMPRRMWEDLKDAGVPGLSRSSSSRAVPKKAAFTPASPETEEIPARSNYFGGFKGDRPGSSADGPPPPPPRPTSSRLDPSRAHHAAGAHASRPYSLHAGERNPLGPTPSGIYRATTNTGPSRDTHNRSDWAHADHARRNGGHARASSAGPSRYRFNGQDHDDASLSSSSDDSSSGEEANVRYVYAEPRKDRERRIPRSQKARMPAGTTTHRTGFSPHVRVENAPDEGEAPHPGLYSGPRRHSGVELPTQNFFGKPDDGHAPTGAGNATPAAPHPASPPSGRGAGETPPLHRHRSLDEKKFSASRQNSGDHEQGDTGKRSPIFKVPGQPNLSPPPHPYRQNAPSDPIEVQFSPSNSPPKFGANGSDRDPSPGTLDDGDIDGDNRFPPPPKVGDKWSSEDWEKRFGTHTFEPPPGVAGSRASSRKRTGTPRTGSLNNLKRAGTNRATGFRPAFVDAGDEPAAPQHAQGDEDVDAANKDAADAMDIDSSPPTAGQQRSVSDEDAELSPGTKSSPVRNGTTKTDPSEPRPSAASRINLGSFRHVAPFSTPSSGTDGAGLDSLPTSLRDSLPHSPRASTSAPCFDKISAPLDLPRVPKAPAPPSANNLTDASWKRYVADMNAYMFNWNSFSSQILLLFSRRQEEKREIGPGWISQVGGDCDAYLHALKEDEKARSYWDIASEKHKEAMLGLKEVRSRMLRMKGLA